MKVAVLRGGGVIAPSVADGFANGFREAGHQVRMIDVSKGYTPIEHKVIQDFKPDFIFGYDYTGIVLVKQQNSKELRSSGLFRQMGIPVICAHYDNPYFGLSKKIAQEMKEYPDYYFNFIWDDYFLKLFQQEGMPNCFPIMLATDPTQFSPVNIKPEPTLAFVGVINTNSMDLSQSDPVMQRFFEIVVQTKVQRLAYPLLDICLQAMEDVAFVKIKQLFIENPYAFWTEIYYPIHAKGSSWYRYSVLNSIEEIPVHVYGAGNWKKDNVIIHDKVPYGRELSKEYQKYAVNLNLSSFQLETSVNNRVFDVFASNSFLLSDYKRDMEKIFPAHWQEVTFANLDELGAKGDYFLTHEAQRRELTEELHQQILKNHTYRHRAEEIISRLNLNNGLVGGFSMNEPKKHEYRGAFNAGLLELLPPGAEKFLDVGCADGAFGAYLLSQGLAKEVVGLEINPVTVEIAGKKLSKILCGNAEELDLPYPEEYFDCLIYGDALEHMVEPEKLLTKHLKHLKGNAYVVCSIPNIRNLFIIHHLLSGNWTYTDWGILDRTHLRFYTLKEIRKMLTKVGLTIEVIKPSLREGEWYAKMYGNEHVGTEFIRHYNGLLESCLKNEDIGLWLKKLFPLEDFSREEAIELFTAQFHIRARKIG